MQHDHELEESDSMSSNYMDNVDESLKDYQKNDDEEILQLKDHI